MPTIDSSIPVMERYLRVISLCILPLHLVLVAFLNNLITTLH